MCGVAVSAGAAECPNCGEPFAPAAAQADDGLEVPPDDAGDEQAGHGQCDECGTPLAADGSCPRCQPPMEKHVFDGCPICGSKTYSVESGDLVSCADCGNVYIKKEYEGPEQSWKWKFWVGLIFILIGNVVVALGSYIHNVLQWSPLGAMYLGYGWIDQFVGVAGIVLFIVGLALFAWSFKRSREVQCPSCKVIVREDQFEVFEEEEEEEAPESMSVESALEEIGEMAECPSCGASVSMYDVACPNCGAAFEAEDVPELEAPAEDAPQAEPGKLLSGSELDENQMVMESLELESPDQRQEVAPEDFDALEELESAYQASMADKAHVTCPGCGATVGRGFDNCPGCGKALPANGKNGKKPRKGGE